MRAAIDWALSNWEPLLAAAWVLLSILNALTGHIDSASGARKLLLLALDWISGLRSGESARSEASPRGLRFKAPLVQLSPPQDRIKKRIAEIEGDKP